VCNRGHRDDLAHDLVQGIASRSFRFLPDWFLTASPHHPRVFIPMPSRSRAREVALQSLYQIEANPGADDLERLQHRERFLKGRLRAASLVDFARSLVEGVQAEQAALDAELDSRSQNWRVARMAATDRAVLRLAAFELLHTDVPGPVAVNEAIELARRYGTEASPRFVAGILGKLLAERDGVPADDAPASS
jgi:N utilization substance protein B